MDRSRQGVRRKTITYFERKGDFLQQCKFKFKFNNTSSCYTNNYKITEIVRVI